MNRFVIVYLSLACVLSESTALSFGDRDESNGFIRVPLEPRRRRAADANGLTSVEMINLEDSHYGFSVEIGTPAQKFDVLLDTGSPDLWVAGVKAKENPDCGGICTAKNYFDEKNSTSFQGTDRNFFLGFLGGGTNGTVAIETVSVGGVTVKNQPFGQVYSGIKPANFDGIIGMTYPDFSQTDNTTIIDRMVDQGQISKKVYCVKLRPEKAKKKSEFIMGGCDVQPEKYAPVMKVNNKYTGWRLNMTKMVLRNTQDKSEVLISEPFHETVLDTGAGGQAGLPTKHFNALQKALGAEYKTTKNGKHWLVDCANWSKYNVEFHFGEAILSIPYDIYSWKYNGECQVGSFYDNGEKGTFFFGTVIFNSATVVFDRDNNQVGFASID